MKKIFIIKFTSLLILIFFSVYSALAQCNYTINSIRHIDCFGQNTGEIDISLDNNIEILWKGPSNFFSSSNTITNLYSGNYSLRLRQFSNPLDTTSQLICISYDTIYVKQTIEISASFELENMCSVSDSADVKTNIIGGTPPYSTLWSNGDTSRNVQNLSPEPLSYILTITDINGCIGYQSLFIAEPKPLELYVSSIGAICKDDEGGSARAYIVDGYPPFVFNWSNDTTLFIEDSSNSEITNLRPGEYIVKVIDSYGCFSSDTIEVKSNPSLCIKIYKAFSPNNDEIHPFWEIKNIHMYPEALVEVYARNGERVYRRRNYQNSYQIAFNGEDQKGRELPSGTYYYIVDLENDDKVLKGTVTIVR